MLNRSLQIISDSITEQREGRSVAQALIKDLNFYGPNAPSAHVYTNFARQSNFLTTLIGRMDKEDEAGVTDGAEGTVRYEMEQLRSTLIHEGNLWLHVTGNTQRFGLNPFEFLQSNFLPPRTALRTASTLGRSLTRTASLTMVILTAFYGDCLGH